MRFPATHGGTTGIRPPLPPQPARDRGNRDSPDRGPAVSTLVVRRCAARPGRRRLALSAHVLGGRRADRGQLRRPVSAPAPAGRQRSGVSIPFSALAVVNKQTSLDRSRHSMSGSERFPPVVPRRAQRTFSDQLARPRGQRRKLAVVGACHAADDGVDAGDRFEQRRPAGSHLIGAPEAPGREQTAP